MFPLNRVGWILGAVGVLTFGFALGWAVATLRDPEPSPITVSSPSPSVGLTPAAIAKSEDKVVLQDNRSAAEVSDLPGDNPGGLIGGFSDALRRAFRSGDYTDRLVRVREMVRGLAAEQLPGAYETANQLPRSQRFMVLSELGKRWAEVDLQGALAAGTSGESSMDNTFLNGVLSKWASAAPSEAKAWVNSLPPSGSRNSLVNGLISAIGQNDPRAATQMLKDQGSSWQGGWAVEELFANWADREPQAAITAASELKGNANYMALRGAARAWAEDNPQAAMAWGERLENATIRKQVMSSVVDQWADSDPRGLIAWSRNVQDEEVRRNAVSRGISQLAAKDLSAALAQIGTLPAGEERTRAVMAAAESRSQQDVRGSIELLNQLESGPERTQALSRMCEVWASSEPRAAVEWLFENNPPSKDGYQLTNVLSRWVERSPEEATAWAQGLPSGEKRETAIAGLAVSLSYLEPARAQKLFDQLTPDAKASVAERFTSALGQQDPNKARAWAEALPPGKAQAVAFGALAYQLANKNVTEAAQWLDTLPVGAGRDRAVIGFSNVAGRRDPEGAMAWALTIADERDRLQQVEALFRNWKAVDSATARKWLNGTNQLPAEQRRRMLER